MEKTSFKERVKNIAIAEAINYKRNYVDYEYLVCSSAFLLKNYYVLDAKEDNYQHLIGVHALIDPKDFFEKCYLGKLEETDFDFIKRGQSEKSVKGSVREKIKVLSNAMNIFNNNTIKIQESFSKNKVHCSFATSDNVCTLGFIDTGKSRPMTLLKGNDLDLNKAKDVSLVLRKSTGKEKFDEIIIGNLETLMIYYEKIKAYVDESLLSSEIKNDNINYKEIAVDQVVNHKEIVSKENSRIDN